MFYIDCPGTCKTCRSGDHHEGGKAVDSNGVCGYFCSSKNYCGDGIAYKSGIDCTKCNQGKYLLDMKLTN